MSDKRDLNIKFIKNKHNKRRKRNKETNIFTLSRPLKIYKY